MAIGRSRLSGIDLLPEECAPIVAWAASELQNRDRTQTSIYEEFHSRLEALSKEHRGELDFVIPSFSAFNRYSIKLATVSARLNQAREIAGTLAEKFDAQASDDLTLIAAEAIKTLIFEILTIGGEAGVDPKGAKALADALRSASQAQSISLTTRQKAQAEFEAKAKEAVKAVAKVRGISEEGAEEILDRILGVTK